jgi:alpha-tubulin suppressor-like RCC1 family protein
MSFARCLAVLVVAVAGSVSSCSSSSSSRVQETCDFGSRKDCLCEDGRPGTSACNDAGTYSVCRCESGSGGTSGSAGSDGAAGTAGSAGVAGSDGAAGVGATSGSGGASSGGTTSSGGSGGSAVDGGNDGGVPASCVVQLVAGSYDTCALNSDRAVRCWGGGTAVPTRIDGSSQVPLAPVVELASGTFHKCARKLDGTVWCWGANSAGQLGNGTTDDSALPVQAKLADGRGTFVQISAGGFSTCGRLQGGTLWCWGAVPGSGAQPVPVAVTAVDSALVSEVVAEGGHSCARMLDGSLRCWGNNADGELGDGTSAAGPKLSSVEVAELGTAVVRSSGRCAIKNDLTLWCWGLNSSGQVGDGTTELRTSPVRVTALGSGIGEVTRTFFKTCARKLDGSVWCWGRNGEGSLGDGTIGGQPCPNGQCKPTPVTVSGIGDASAIAAGIAHACAARPDGVWCWGANSQGQLGDGTRDGEACAGGPCRPRPARSQVACP